MPLGDITDRLVLDACGFRDFWPTAFALLE